jgi:hypothetical protein
MKKRRTFMDKNCPICGNEAIKTCKCVRHDRECRNHHRWHTCSVHGVVVLGASDHSLNIDVCTCKREAEIDIKTKILNALDDWLHTYASEFCDEKHVIESMKRIEENGGTLSYIAQLRNEIMEKL